MIVQKGDILSDGVNVAARLEGLAEPGGICLSEDAYRQVKGKVGLEFESLSKQDLKNLAEPLLVYHAAIVSQEASVAPSASGLLPLPDKPSIAVLCFDNLSGDPEQDYFAQGIAEDIIDALSRFNWFFVISRNPSFAYKGRSGDAKRTGRELGVSYLLQGSLRKSGNRVRITAQLIDAVGDRQIWAERFDRVLEDILPCRTRLPKPLSAR